MEWHSDRRWGRCYICIRYPHYRAADYRTDRHAIPILYYRDQADSRCLISRSLIIVGRLWANIQPSFFIADYGCLGFDDSSSAITQSSISGLLEVFSNLLNNKRFYEFNPQKIVSWEVMRVFNANSQHRYCSAQRSPKDDWYGIRAKRFRNFLSFSL